MIMSESEICKEYRNAKIKSKQITILADLNCTTRKKITDILVKNGEMDRGFDFNQADYKRIIRFKNMTRDQLMDQFAKHMHSIGLIYQAIEFQDMQNSKREEILERQKNSKLIPIEKKSVYFTKKNKEDIKIAWEEVTAMFKNKGGSVQSDGVLQQQ